MNKAVTLITAIGIMLTGCATPAPSPSPTSTAPEIVAQPTPTRPPTNTPVPSPTPTISPANEGCVRATTEIPEGQNPTRYINSGPASGCYDSVGGFLDDIGLAWEDFAPGTVITFWTEWPVGEGGQVVYPTPTPIPISVTISPSMDDGFEYVCGHPPFTVDFSAQVSGGRGDLQYAWDFNVDGATDATVQDPEPFTYQTPGLYNATITVSEGAGQATVSQRRVVVIGEPTWPGWRYGVMAHIDLIHGHYENAAETDRAVQMIADAGIEAVRVDFAWSIIEASGDDRYDWSDYDRIVRLVTSHGLELLPIIDFSPQWASSNPADQRYWEFPPSDPQAYADIVGAIVNRYRDDVHVWQIWQEPNLDRYFRGADPQVYTQLLQKAYIAIKYTDPSAVVTTGPLPRKDGDPTKYYVPGVTFLDLIYSNGGKGYFDAVAIDTYNHPTYEGVDALINELNSLRNVMVANGDPNLELWVTENGWPSYDDVSEEAQAQWLTDSYNAMLGLDYIGPVLWYNFRDKGTDPSEWEHNTGLIRRDWTPKPAYFALRDFIASL